MSQFRPNILSNTIETIFANNQQNPAERRTGQKKNKNRGAERKQLELAMTVLLVELASSDQNFDPREYNLIANGLMRIFGTPRTEISALVNRAKLALDNFSGTTRFAEMLQKNLSEEARKQLMEVINDVIMADGVEDGFEIFLRQKFARLLDIPLAT